MIYDINGGQLVAQQINGQWRKADATIETQKIYTANNTIISTSSKQSCTLSYVLNGEKKVRICAEALGSSDYPAYAIVKQDGTILVKPEYTVTGETFRNVVVDVPDGAYAVHVNGGTNNCSCYLEVLVDDTMADNSYSEYLERIIARKVMYHDKFAWKTMPQPLIAFVFDDSQPNISTVVDLFESKNVPCCFAAIPEYLNKGCESGETVAQAMQRGVEECGCEVLAHGGNLELVNSSRIDDMNELYSKFILSTNKFYQMGFSVRGCMMVGGSGQIEHDSRTAPWVKLVFDYCDNYGTEEPYYHLRKSSTSESGWYNILNAALAENKFTALCLHTPPSYLSDLIDYVIAGGGKICTYAYAYDTYGSTEKEVALLNRISALEAT